MELLNYGELVALWKIRLIVRRSRRYGFRSDQINDILQEIVLDVIKFQYIPSISNGATEKTALTALIDNRLRKMIRSAGREKNRIEKIQQDQHTTDHSDNHTALQLDVLDAVTSLDDFKKSICSLLANGYSENQIAQLLKVKIGRASCRERV